MTHILRCAHRGQRSEDNLQESVLSYHEDSREETQDVRLDGKHLHELSNPAALLGQF